MGENKKMAHGARNPAKGAARNKLKNVILFLSAHPQRAYFSKLLDLAGWESGLEVGVAGGRFSELFLLQSPKHWMMMEPFPNKDLLRRGGATTGGVDSPASWSSRGIGTNTNKTFFKLLSTDSAALQAIPLESVDFIYLDGAHNYANVKAELEPYWQRVRPGGMLAGHDYCNYGEKGLSCLGCSSIPSCGPYTEIRPKDQGRRASNQAGVVRAIQEWLVESHPELTLRHTIENFTRASLAADAMDYDLVITSTRSPSWYFLKAPRRDYRDGR